MKQELMDAIQETPVIAAVKEGNANRYDLLPTIQETSAALPPSCSGSTRRANSPSSM